MIDTAKGCAQNTKGGLSEQGFFLQTLSINLAHAITLSSNIYVLTFYVGIHPFNEGWTHSISFTDTVIKLVCIEKDGILL